VGAGPDRAGKRRRPKRKQATRSGEANAHPKQRQAIASDDGPSMSEPSLSEPTLIGDMS
jgi:hypothetical protein